MQFFLVGLIFLEAAPYLHTEHFWQEKEIATTLGICTWASLLSLFGELKFWQRYPRLHSGDIFKVIQCPLSIPPSRAWKFFSSVILSSWTSYLILFHTHKRNTKPQERKCMHAGQKEVLMYAFALFLLLWRIRGYTHWEQTRVNQKLLWLWKDIQEL